MDRGTPQSVVRLANPDAACAYEQLSPQPSGCSVLSLSRSSSPSVCHHGVHESRYAILSVALQLALSAIGPGLLTLPYGMAQAGWPLSVFFIGVSGYISARAVVVMLQARTVALQSAVENGAAFSGPATYGDLVKLLLGPKSAYFLDVILVVNGAGIAISFLIFLGGFAPPAVQAIVNGLGITNPFVWAAIQRTPLLTAMSVICVMLGCAQDVGKYRWLGFLPIVGLIWTALTLIVRIFHVSNRGELNLIESLQALMFFRPTLAAFMNLNLFLFSTMMQVNVVPIIKNKPHLTRHSLMKSLAISHGSICVFYVVLATLGCLAVMPAGGLSNVQQNFTIGLPIRDRTIAVMRVVLTIALLSIAPYLFVAVSSGMIDLWNGKHTAAEDDLENPMNNPMDRHTRPSHNGRSRFLAASVLIGVSYVVALHTDKVATTISLTGGIGTTTLMCTIPAMLRSRYCQLRASDPHPKKTWTSLIDDKFTTPVLWTVAGLGYLTTLIIVI